MVILLYGSDSYRRLKRLKELTALYEQKNSEAVIQKFDFENSGGETDSSILLKFKEFARNQPLFGPKKLAILENVWQERKKGKSVLTTRDSIAELKKILKSAGSSEDFTVFISDSAGPKSGFDFLFEKPNRSEEFEELKGQKLKLFIEKEANEKGISLSELVIDFLVDNFKGQSWGAVTEIEKLRWLKTDQGNRGVGIEEIKSLGNYAESPDIFSFINLLGYRTSIPERLVSLEKLLFLKEEPLKIFNFLASRTYDPSLLRRLADYDIMVKSGKIDYEEILLELAIS